jgi:ABC-type Fe3+ transport system substrate-binding protein
MILRRQAGLSIAAAIILGLGISLNVSGAQAQDWQAGGGEKWANLLAAAKKEGKVALAAPSQLSGPMTENFKRDTGIDLDFLGGETRDLSARFNREARSKNVTIDLILSGGAQFPLLETNDLAALKPQIILPGSGDGKHWADGKIKWMDAGGEYMLQATNFVLSYAIVNTDLTKGQFRNWKDLLKPQFKGKIAAHDPRAGGPGLGIATTLAQSLGVDFMKQLFVDQEVTYSRDSRQLVEGVVRGTYAVALGASRTEIEMFRKQFKQLDIVVPEDAPGTLVGGFSVLKQAKGTPHPNASAVFVNWFASRRGQETFQKAMDEPSRRTDIPDTNFPSYMLPQPGAKYIDQYEENWYQNERTKIQEEVIKALGGR